MGWFEVGFEGALSVSVLAKVFFGSSLLMCICIYILSKISLHDQ